MINYLPVVCRDAKDVLAPVLLEKKFKESSNRSKRLRILYRIMVPVRISLAMGRRKQGNNDLSFYYSKMRLIWQIIFLIVKSCVPYRRHCVVMRT
jgi:hypothetical protein